MTYVNLNRVVAVVRAFKALNKAEQEEAFMMLPLPKGVTVTLPPSGASTTGDEALNYRRSRR